MGWCDLGVRVMSPANDGSFTGCFVHNDSLYGRLLCHLERLQCCCSHLSSPALVCTCMCAPCSACVAYTRLLFRLSLPCTTLAQSPLGRWTTTTTTTTTTVSNSNSTSTRSYPLRFLAHRRNLVQAGATPIYSAVLEGRMSPRDGPDMLYDGRRLREGALVERLRQWHESVFLLSARTPFSYSRKMKWFKIISSLFQCS